NYPTQAIEAVCKEQASVYCIGNGRATSSPTLFSQCWNDWFDQCVDFYYRHGQFHRGDSNCISQDHSIDVCYQNEAKVEAPLLSMAPQTRSSKMTTMRTRVAPPPITIHLGIHGSIGQSSIC
uniref:Uncharacterized protein n=1 Tax=Clytia hemisphaerica TaxID=252671 RepID=A0A7M5U1T1_9CNID